MKMKALNIEAQKMPATSKDTAEPVALEISEKSPLILVVEDNLVNQKVIKGFLKKLGYEADMAEDGQQALEAIELKNYDLVFMDCEMPVMDGYRATEQIRQKENSTTHLPVIAMTANAMKGDEDKCFACGMDDYLTKPLNMPVLEKTLHRWLNSTQI